MIISETIKKRLFKEESMKERFFYVFILLALFSTQAWSANLEHFNKRFKFVRDQDGRLVKVLDASIGINFNLKLYLEFLKNKILEEQERAQKMKLTSYAESLEADLGILANVDEASLESKYKNFEHREKVLKALLKLAEVNIDLVYKNEAFLNTMQKFGDKLYQFLNQVDPRVIASPQNASFFFKRAQLSQVTRYALSFAKGRIKNNQLLQVAIYIILEVEKKILEQRDYHQNMLLYYLENFHESELGLSREEVNLIWSSIYESKIPWFAFWESKNAKADWQKYGVRSFYSEVRRNQSRMFDALEQKPEIYNELDVKINSTFAKIKFKNEWMILNLKDNHGMFNSNLAQAYVFSTPTKIARERLLLGLAGFGIQFLPINNSVKSAVQNYCKSFYEKQKITEGALYAYFESNNWKVEKNILANQYLNPFDNSL